MAHYELGILGYPKAVALGDIRAELRRSLRELGLNEKGGVKLHIGSVSGFAPKGDKCAAALCFQTSVDDAKNLEKLLQRGIPIIPVADSQKNFSKEVPEVLADFNGLSLDRHDVQTLVNSLLECAGMLPKQRRVFISYRRDESTDVAQQLYAALSARLFDVFLDTHGIHPAEHFQDVLWQRLCDCDVLLMLDTARYFDSRWTAAEFGRALSRGLAFVRVGWPRVVASPRASMALPVALSTVDFEKGGGRLKDDTILKICQAVESARTKSVAARHKDLVSTLRDRVEKVQGKLNGVALKRSILITLADKRKVIAYPTLGVPTSFTLHHATLDNYPPPVAVVYDDMGLDEVRWRAHMEWMAQHTGHVVRLVSAHKAGWEFSDWFK